jgi:hypothetical protein
MVPKLLQSFWKSFRVCLTKQENKEKINAKKKKWSVFSKHVFIQKLEA